MARDKENANQQRISHVVQDENTPEAETPRRDFPSSASAHQLKGWKRLNSF